MVAHSGFSLVRHMRNQLLTGDSKICQLKKNSAKWEEFHETLLRASDTLHGWGAANFKQIRKIPQNSQKHAKYHKIL